jgi:hypothetical protein
MIYLITGATGNVGSLVVQMAAKIGAAIGKTLRFEPISEFQARRQMTDSGDAPEIVAVHLSIYRAIREGCLATVTDTIERVLGRKPITFDQWIQENVGAFADSVHAF